MAEFITRIVLYDADEPHREILHQGMLARNFQSTHFSADGSHNQLPEGTYFSQSFYLNAKGVRDLATGAAVATGCRYDVVTVCGDIAYSLHPAR